MSVSGSPATAIRSAYLPVSTVPTRPAQPIASAATRVNAEIFRMERDIGAVEPGKYADLIAIKGNPLEDLTLFQNANNLELIMKGGAIYKLTL